MRELIGLHTVCLQLQRAASAIGQREGFLLTRSLDRKNATIRVGADEVADMVEQERDLSCNSKKTAVSSVHYMET